MRPVYLIRHGETDLNAKRIHQHAEVPLSETGYKQARFLGGRVKALLREDVGIYSIIASTMLRAKQTALCIAETTGLPIEFTELFREVTNPTDMIGLGYDDPEVIAIEKRMLLNINDSKWHHGGEENFSERQTRANRAVNFLSTRPSGGSIVVTHGTFKKHLLLAMLGVQISPLDFPRWDDFFESSNTGITRCTYVESRWRLEIWNDRAHLAEPYGTAHI